MMADGKTDGRLFQFLYHGGAPGFRPGDIIEPHETKLTDGCPVCEAGADANHLPDRVFATAERIYGKYYASKYGSGTLYIVEPEGELVRSADDPFETYHAPALRVLKVSERGVRLTMTERRRLYRLWGEEDQRRGLNQDAEATAIDFKMRQMLGIR